LSVELISIFFKRRRIIMDFEVIRKKTIEVKIVDDNAVVLIETDNNGQFIKAKAFDLEAYNSEQYVPIDFSMKVDRLEKEFIPHGTLTVSHSSPYCIRYVDGYRNLIKICSPGAVC
jgi:hypothetical protein